MRSQSWTQIRLDLLNDNERTFLAWLRTATALFGLACATAKFGVFLESGARGPSSESGTYCSGILLLILAMAAVVLGMDDYHRRRNVIARGTLSTHAHHLRSRALYPLATLVGFAGISLLAILLLLQ